MLDILKSSKIVKDVIVSGYSKETLKWADNCINELYSSGVVVGKRLCHFRMEDNHFNLYYSIKQLGFLSNKKDGTDVTFKRFLSYLKDDIGEDFYCVVFPCEVSYFSYSGKLVVFKTEESFRDTYEKMLASVRVIAYDNLNTALSLENLAFNLVGDYGKRYNRLRNLILNCNGNAQMMVKRLDISGFGYVDWEVVKDDFYSQKIVNKDSLGNIRYLEVIL